MRLLSNSHFSIDICYYTIKIMSDITKLHKQQLKPKKDVLIIIYYNKFYI